MSEQLNTQQSNANQQLKLEDFFPYKLTELQDAISQNLSQVYKEHNLSRQQWRIVAVLGDNDKAPDSQALSAKQLGDLTNLDKMQTSRAIAKLKDAKRVSINEDQNDKRSILVSLTDQGLKLHEALVPKVLAHESRLLSALTPRQYEQFTNMMEKLLKQANR